MTKEPKCPKCSGNLFRDEHPDGYMASPYYCEDCEHTDRVSELDDIQENTDSLEEKLEAIIQQPHVPTDKEIIEFELHHDLDDFIADYNGTNKYNTRQELREEYKRLLTIRVNKAIAQAVKEERERIMKILHPIEKEDLLPLGKAISEWVRLHEELKGEIVWQNMGDDFGDGRRMRPIKAIYKTPLEIFHGMSGLNVTQQPK